MKTKYLIIFLLLAISPLSRILAQPDDYDDFYKKLPTLTEEKIYSKLIVYQRLDPYFVNTYAQLGVVTKKLMLKSDPLKDFDQAITWANEGILYLSLFTHYMPENESRSNRSFYANLPINRSDGSKCTNADLVSFAVSLTKQLQVYRDSLMLVYHSLEKSKELYGKCIDLYKNLNTRFNSLNEILLQTDAAVIEEINKLNILFDSTIYFFNRYSDLTKIFPLKDYHQTYQLKPIKTFRLDGLSNSNFLAQNFDIWDFGTWTDEFKMVFNNEIVPLRLEIGKVNQWYSQYDKGLIERTVENKDIPKPIFDDKFIFKLGKFDNNSLVRDLFAFRNSKHNFLLEYNEPLNSPVDSVVDLLSRKARYYNNLKNNKLKSDSLLAVFEKSISTEKINRFNEFFSSVYGGKTGLINFCDQQKNESKKLLDLSFDNLKYFLKYQKDTYEKIKYAKYKNDSIPTFICPAEYSGKFKTNDVFWISGKPAYVAGFDYTKTSATPFVASIGKDGKVKWYKQPDKAHPLSKDGTNPFFSKVFGYKGGVINIYTKQNPDLTNIVVKFDSTGKELSRSTLQISSVATFLKFDDINQRTLLGFKGKNKEQSELLESTTISLTDSTGNMKWKALFDLAGNIVDIVKTETLYQVFLNYKSYSIMGKSGSANPDGTGWGTLLLNLDEQGAVKDIIPIKQAFSYHVTNVVKLSGQTICLIGYKTDYGNTEAPLFFSILNGLGEVLYSN